MEREREREGRIEVTLLESMRSLILLLQFDRFENGLALRLESILYFAQFDLHDFIEQGQTLFDLLDGELLDSLHRVRTISARQQN